MVDEFKEDNELNKLVKPTINETYAILLESSEPFIGEVLDINEIDHIIIIKNNKDGKEHSFIIKDEILVFNSDKYDYNIIDIERIQLFDIDILKHDIEQLTKTLTSDIIQDLDISLDEILDKDIVYKEVELREDIISHLIQSFNAYDNYSLIRSINSSVDNIFELLIEDEQIYLYNINFEKTLPKWLLPIIDNPLKLYSNQESLDEYYNLYDQGNFNYNQRIVHILDHYRPFQNSLSNTGYSTNEYISNYFRDCLQTETCIGVKGNYKYDMRKNKNPYISIYDNEKQLMHSSDYLNITGLLYIPDNKLIHSLDLTTSYLTLKEQCLLDSVSKNNLHNLKQKSIISKVIDESLVINDLDQLILYSIPNRIDSKDEFNELLKIITPSFQDIVSSLDKDVSNKIINYKDVQNICIKYGIDLYKLLKGDIDFINKLIKENVDLYLSNNSSLQDIIIKNNSQELNIYQKINLSLNMILSMINISIRNEYLQKYIDVFTRPPYTNEYQTWLYNIYTNEKILCKHYLFSSIYHNNRIAYDSMITIYGKTPVDGCIYCKNCGEYLCQEDYSEFDGFSDEQPILLREEIKTTINILEQYKEEDILLVKQISGSIGVNIIDEDISLILNIYSTFNNDIIANKRYNTMNITTSDEHPIVNSILKKYSKDKNKKELISKGIKQFQNYLKFTNKIIGLISLIILVIYSSIPIYNFKNSNYSFISFTTSLSTDTIEYNIEVLNYSIYKLNKLSQSYQTDKYWIEYKQLINEHKLFDLPTIKQQILNMIHYIVSPLYPTIQERLISYSKFIQSSSNTYINFEWPLFKPLGLSELSTQVNNLLVSNDTIYKENYILNYNNYPVENISMISSIYESKDIPIYKLVNIPVSEILVNQAFLRLFYISVSNYGQNKGIFHSIDLHIEHFLQTIKDSDTIRDIFIKHGWISSNKSGHISYKILRNKIIPDIIKHYLKLNTDISTCYSNEKLCNQFIHTNVNNYDLHLFKTQQKRYYAYIPFIIYPEHSFNEVSDDFKYKLFKRYCKDPSGNIIKRYISNNYLGTYLIDTLDVLETNYVSIYEHSLHKDESNFDEILQNIHKELSIYLYVKPKETNIDDYNIDISRINTEQELLLLQILRRNEYYGLNEEHPIIISLNHISTKTDINKTILESVIRELNNSFSQLPFDSLKYTISEFISTVLVDTTNINKKKRFENIFINTSSNINISEDDRKFLETDGFRYKNMRESDIYKIFELFMNNDNLDEPLMKHYIYTIKSILSKLSYSYTTSNYIPSTWKLSDYNRSNYKDYITNNSFLLHQDIFKRESIYRGFNNYNKPYLFVTLFNYIQPYLQDLDKLKINDKLINKTIEYMISKYILFFIIKQIIDFYNKLKDEDENILNEIEQNISNDDDFDLLESLNILENFIIDLLTNMLEVHYDSRWIVSNNNQGDLKQRLSKQKEKEKQQLIQNLDTMTDEKRASTTEKQKLGIISMYHESMSSNDKRVIDEYSSIDEGLDEYSDKEIVDAVININTGNMDIVQGNIYNVLEGNLGYFNENDIDDDGELGDELHDFYNEGLLDNEFNE